MTLREWRKQAGLSQADAAQKIQIPRWTYISYEMGRRRPSLRQALRIEKITQGQVTSEDIIIHYEAKQILRETVARP